jgi:ParB family chromosome partitioning protein
MTRHKGLGRGLDALLGGATKPKTEDELARLPIASLRPGKYQPRTRMDEASLAELAESIRARGVIQPIVVRPVEEGRYEILAGERRWRAARLAGQEEVPALIREVPDEVALGIGLIENIQREDLNPIEEGNGLKRLIEEFKLTHEGGCTCRRPLARRGHQHAPSPRARAVRAGNGPGRKARHGPCARLAFPFARTPGRDRGARRGKRTFGPRDRAPRAASGERAAAQGSAGTLDADGRRLQEELSETLGATVKLKPRRGGRGSLVIDYASLDELQGLIGRLRKP